LATLCAAPKRGKAASLLLAWVIVGVVAGARAWAETTPVGTVIEASASMSYDNASGQSVTITSNVVKVTVSDSSQAPLFFSPLEGQVTDSVTAGPVVDATVNVYRNGTWVDSCVTEAPWGIYRFAQELKPGTYQTIVTCGGYSPASKIGISVTAGTTTHINFRLVASSGIAGATQVTGKVTDAVTGAGLVGATVLTFRDGVPSGRARTDTQGEYVIGGLAAGNYAVDALCDGYVTTEQSGLTLGSGQSAVVDFLLKRQDSTGP